MAGNYSEEKGFETQYLDDGTPIWNVLSYNARLYPVFENSFTERLDEMQSGLKMSESDICILAYMKSGTHWLWEIVNMLTKKADSVSKDNGKAEGFFEMTTLETLEQMAPPRILSTHIPPTEPLTKLILNSKARIIVPVRNPKDTVVSLYHHLSSEIGGSNLRCGWDRFLSHVWFSHERMVYSEWFDFTHSLRKVHKNRGNMLFISYEQMKKHPVQQIKEMAAFLQEETTLEECERIADLTNFEKMKGKKAKWEEEVYQSFAPKYSMYRKGTIGDWKNKFTVAQNEYFDQQLEAAVKGCGDDDMIEFIKEMVYH